MNTIIIIIIFTITTIIIVRYIHFDTIFDWLFFLFIDLGISVFKLLCVLVSHNESCILYFMHFIALSKHGKDFAYDLTLPRALFEMAK